MKGKMIIFFATFLMSVIGLQGAEKFKRISQWVHEDVTLYKDFSSFVDGDNHLICSFYKEPVMIITPKNIIKFAHYGKGPSDLTDTKTGFLYKGDLAIVEKADKIKIFTKKHGTYVWKKTKWLRRGKYPHDIKDGIFTDNKFFLAGVEYLSFNKQNKTEEVSLMKVYDENGQPLKQLINITFAKPNRFYEMRYYVEGYKTGRVFFLKENELRVHVVSVKTLEVVKEIDLEIPPFYKKMPEVFYIFKKYKDFQKYLMDLETWVMSYSSITEVGIDGDYLVVQIRTCSDRLKTFALLFYNVEDNFKLEKTIFTDDYLLDVKDGKYYCFANGNPGLDENTDACIINIYAFEKEK